jgi:hypothetical protein
MSLPGSCSIQPAWLFGVERIDTWVLRVSIAIPLLCLAGLALWQVVAYLTRKLAKKPRILRHSPEPSAPNPSPMRLPGALADILPAAQHARELLTLAGDDPERLEQACTALEDALAEMYLDEAERWLHAGQQPRGVAAFKKVLQACPGGRPAVVAQERLRQIGAQTCRPEEIRGPRVQGDHS